MLVYAFGDVWLCIPPTYTPNTRPIMIEKNKRNIIILFILKIFSYSEICFCPMCWEKEGEEKYLYYIREIINIYDS